MHPRSLEGIPRNDGYFLHILVPIFYYAPMFLCLDVYMPKCTPMDEELKSKLQQLEQKIDATYASAEKTRKYFLWTMIGSLVAFVLPLIGMIFAVPFLLNTLMGQYQGLL